jgi:hypothetical protein
MRFLVVGRVIDFTGFFEDFQGFSRTSRVSQRLSRIFEDFRGFSKTFKASQRLPGLLKDFQGFSMTSQGFSMALSFSIILTRR